MLSLEELFWDVDEFCQQVEPCWRQQLLSDGLQHRQRERSLSVSEIMTSLIAFHQSASRQFKAFYTQTVSVYWQSAFPGLVSYQRFVEWKPDALLPLCAYLRSCFGTCTGISFLDATSLKVCHNRRIAQHRVFVDLAARGKTSVDWFFGFKLHLVVNERGELLNFTLTPGNTDDRVFCAKTVTKAGWQGVRRPRLHFSRFGSPLTGNLWHSVARKTEAEHEKPLDDDGR